MPEPGRLGPAQLALLIITATTIWGHMVVVREVFAKVGRDAWLSGLTGGLAGLGLVVLISLWMRRWPRQNLFALMQQRLKWASLPLTLAYLGYFFLHACLAARVFGTAFNLLMPETPELAIVALLVLLSTYAVITGLEPTARTVQILLVFLTLVASTILVFGSAKDMDWVQLRPMLAGGLAPLLRGTVSILAWLCDLTLMLMLHPVVRNLRSPWWLPLLTLGALIVMMIGPLMGPVLIFGPDEAARLLYPTFEQIRYMRMGTFIENLDALAVLLWTVGLYGRMALFHYLLSAGAAQAFSLRDYRSLVVPLGVIIGGSTTMISHNTMETYDFLIHSMPVFNLCFGLVLPAVLLLAGFLLGWRDAGSSKRKETSS